MKEQIIRHIPLLITNKEGTEIFSVEIDGSVNWMKDGKLTKAKTKDEMALAFATALAEINNIN